jgi:hypothetical protein
MKVPGKPVPGICEVYDCLLDNGCGKGNVILGSYTSNKFMLADEEGPN